jgi:hypothetical protein
MTRKDHLRAIWVGFGWSEQSTPATRGDRPPAVLSTLTLAAAVALTAGPAGRAWAAAWTDAVAVTQTTIQAARVPPPGTFTCGAVGAFSVSFSWAAVPGATTYTLHYGSGGTSTLTASGTTATITTVVSSGTAWVVANHDYGSTTWTSTASATRTYTVAVASLCS